jgi:CheY-like chemotaxis protein
VHILLVDDSVSERLVIGQYLKGQGHSVQEAGDGRKALEAAARERFDLILMDNVMPEMDGAEAARHIRKLDQQLGHYTPILLISGLHDPDAVIASLGEGADDYLLKPVHFGILGAKLRVFERIALQHRSLEAYRAASEADKSFARVVLDHLTRTNRALDTGVYHHTASQDHTGGDLFASLRAPDGSLYALLADAMGHGLAAAFTTVLLAQIFYAMAQRGMPLASMAKEANAKLKDLLPAGFFIAAAFVRVTPERREVQVWNGGLPAVRLLGADGTQRAFESRHLPLGIAASNEFDMTLEQHVCSGPAKILLATDGVTEAEQGRVPPNWWLDLKRIPDTIARLEPQDDASVAVLNVP